MTTNDPAEAHRRIDRPRPSSLCAMYPILPKTCERAILERFLRAEAMALWSVRAGQSRAVPAHVLAFLRRHEAEEEQHLRQFESILDTRARERTRLPRVPAHWPALAVHLYGYESLGLEFARLLAGLRPDLGTIVRDEETHVAFFAREVKLILEGDARQADEARRFARAWWRRIPRTVDKYLQGDELSAYHADLHRSILAALERRFAAIGLLVPSSAQA